MIVSPGAKGRDPSASEMESAGLCCCTAGGIFILQYIEEEARLMMMDKWKGWFRTFKDRLEKRQNTDLLETQSWAKAMGGQVVSYM